ncbi:MAG: hypothetical protein K2N72_09270, partial [Oscillospiraceae bacterium]|nr:hypothetical protein [Oscillospiraceae bacterium]
FISLVIVTKMDDSFTAAAIAVSIIGELLWLCGVILKNGRAYGKLIREIYKMPDEDFASMCVQVKETKPHFKTVYVLDRYLYVPSELFLLPLESVRRVESEIRSNSLRIFYAYLIIFHGRKRTRIKIKRKGEFRNNHVMFVRDLCDKCSDIKGENMIREKAGKINDKYD